MELLSAVYGRFQQISTTSAVIGSFRQHGIFGQP
jgi:hypothetical protein